jgi:protocatechuate 3,4-dioxygenase beta subunit
MTLNLSRKFFLFSASLSLLLILYNLNSVALAQAVFGNIIGSVTDPSGSAVPNASVDITDADRGTSYHVVTNDSGNFELTHLLAGHYKGESHGIWLRHF